MEQWAELRREHFVAGTSIKELARSTGLSHNTIRRALRSETPPSYQQTPRPACSIRSRGRSTGCSSRIPSCRVCVFVSCLSRWAARSARRSSTTICARCVRCSLRRGGRFNGTVYRPGELCQFDVWEPRNEVPVGHGQTRRGWAVIACLGYSRAGAGVLTFGKETEDLLAGVAGCLERSGGLPTTRGPQPQLDTARFLMMTPRTPSKR